MVSAAATRITYDDEFASAASAAVIVRWKKGPKDTDTVLRTLNWVLGRGRRSKHDKVLKKTPKSPYILNDDLTDDAWLICTEDPQKRNADGVIIRFDAILGPGGLRLNGPRMEHHLLTAKILINGALTPGIGWCSSDIKIRQFFTNLLLMLRWMHRHQIDAIADLHDVHFEIFKEELTQGGIEGLYPILPPLGSFLTDVVAGRDVLPLYIDGGKRRVHYRAIAHKLGLATAKALSTEALKRINVVATQICPTAVRTSYNERPPSTSSRNEDKDSLTQQRVASVLEPWLRLWQLRHRLSHDRIKYRAFVPGESLWKVASQLGRETGRTKDIPHNLLATLLDQALRWISYADDIRKIADALEKAVRSGEYQSVSAIAQRKITKDILTRHLKDKPKEPGAPWLMIPMYARFWGNSRNEVVEGLDFRSVLTLLMFGACYFLIGIFTARRSRELASLRSGVIIRDHGLWMRAWIGKNVRDVRRIPVPECVAKAVEILEWLSAGARKETGEDWLFTFQELTTRGKVVGINKVKALNEFAAFVGVPKLPDGSTLLLSPHQLRRAFAVLYFYRFRMPSLVALSWFLQHYDIEMTWRYITTLISGELQIVLDDRFASEERKRAAKSAQADAAAAAAAFEQIGKQFVVEVLTLAEQGQEPVRGAGGEVLMLELEHYLAPTRRMITASNLGPEESKHTLTNAIIAFAEGKRLVPNPLGTSYCKCTSAPADLQVANCLKLKRAREGANALVGASGPDLSYAEPRACLGCGNGVQLPENAPHIDQYIAEQTQVAETANGPHLCEAARKRAEEVYNNRVRFYGEPTAGEQRKAGGA